MQIFCYLLSVMFMSFSWLNGRGQLSRMEVHTSIDTNCMALIASKPSNSIFLSIQSKLRMTFLYLFFPSPTNSHLSFQVQAATSFGKHMPEVDNEFLR